MRRGSMAWVLALGIAWEPERFAGGMRRKPSRPTAGNWFTRIFVRDSFAKKKEIDRRRTRQPPLSPTQLRQKAIWGVAAPPEVAISCRQIALETGIPDLSARRTTWISARWDVYVQRGRTKTVPRLMSIPDSRLGR